MKKVLLYTLLLFLSENIFAQQVDCPHFLKNDSSYLKLNNDTAEFKIYGIKYHHQYVKGRGPFWLKDNKLYIKTVYISDEEDARFEDVGHMNLKEKLNIEVINGKDNTIFSMLNISLYGEKNINSYNITTENGHCYVDLNTVDNPKNIRIRAYENSTSLIDVEMGISYFFELWIPIDSIKTDKIRASLTCGLFVYDKLVSFEIGKDSMGLFVIGPEDEKYKESLQKYNSKFINKLLGRRLLPTRGYGKIKMYASEDS